MTRHAIIDGCGYTLDVTVADDADLDDEFEATCNDTGDRLRIKGWLIESIEWQPDLPMGEAA